MKEASSKCLIFISYLQHFVTSMYGVRAFQQKVRNSMGINCAPRKLVPLFV